MTKQLLVPGTRYEVSLGTQQGQRVSENSAALYVSAPVKIDSLAPTVLFLAKDDDDLYYDSHLTLHGDFAAIKELGKERFSVKLGPENAG